MKRRGPGDCRWAAAVALFCCLIIEVLGDCGIPPPIDSAKLKDEYAGKTTFSVGSVASYVCDQGYGKKPGMSDTITCQDSTWSEIPEFCERTCGPPTSFRFAELKSQFTEMNIFPVGTIVSYNCRPGYIPIPEKSSSITCLQNLTWSIVEPFCERKSCGSPGELINGGVDLEDNLFGSTATFFCNPGYRLVGRNKRLCLYTGSWSNVVPICEAVICPSPANIDGGTHSGIGRDEFTYLSAVTYRCTSDTLTLIGEASIHCTQYGNWSAEPPKCKVVSCTDPFVQNGKKISGFGHSYKYGQSVEFECDRSFTLVGSSSIKCGEDSDWHPPAPACLQTTTPSTAVTTTVVVGGGSTAVTSTTSGTSTETQKTTITIATGEGSHVGLIFGILAGLFCLVVVGAVYYVCKKKKEGVYDTNENKDVPLNPKVAPSSQSAESDKIAQ